MSVLVTESYHTENLLQFLGVSILFIFVVLATYFTTKIIGGIKLGQLKNSNFKVIETFKITQNKYLQIIQVGTRYFVIAVGKDEISLITEINETDIQLIETDKGQAIHFSEIIARVTNKQFKNEDKRKPEDNKYEKHE